MKMTLTYLFAGVFIFALFALAFVTSGRAAPKFQSEINVPRLCEAIKDVENTPHYHVGAAGERSSWQITPDVWQAHSTKPFWHASVNGGPYDTEIKRVVVMHILWIRRRLQSLALEDSPHNIALVYKAGYGRCLSKKTRKVDQDYAKRVANVYYDAP